MIEGATGVVENGTMNVRELFQAATGRAKEVFHTQGGLYKACEGPLPCSHFNLIRGPAQYAKL